MLYARRWVFNLISQCRKTWCFEYATLNHSERNWFRLSTVLFPRAAWTKALAWRCGGKLGFADSFLHGRLGSLLLKRLSEHAYGRTSKLDEELVSSLNAMVKRLEVGEAKSVKATSKQRWFVYTDASYEPETKTACFWMPLEGWSPGLVWRYRKMCARPWAVWSKTLWSMSLKCWRRISRCIFGARMETATFMSGLVTMIVWDMP